MNFFEQLDSVESLVQLVNDRDGTQGGLSVQQEPPCVFEPAPAVREIGAGKAIHGQPVDFPMPCLQRLQRHCRHRGCGRRLSKRGTRASASVWRQQAWQGFRVNLEDLIRVPDDVKLLSCFLKPNEKKVNGKRGWRKA